MASPVTLCRSMAIRASVSMWPPSFPAFPSIPRPTLTPASSSCFTGAMPASITWENQHEIDVKDRDYAISVCPMYSKASTLELLRTLHDRTTLTQNAARLIGKLSCSGQAEQRSWYCKDCQTHLHRVAGLTRDSEQCPPPSLQSAGGRHRSACSRVQTSSCSGPN